MEAQWAQSQKWIHCSGLKVPRALWRTTNSTWECERLFGPLWAAVFQWQLSCQTDVPAKHPAAQSFPGTPASAFRCHPGKEAVEGACQG